MAWEVTSTSVCIKHPGSTTPRARVALAQSQACCETAAGSAGQCTQPALLLETERATAVRSSKSAMTHQGKEQPATTSPRYTLPNGGRLIRASPLDDAVVCAEALERAVCSRDVVSGCVRPDRWACGTAATPSPDRYHAGPLCWTRWHCRMRAADCWLSVAERSNGKPMIGSSTHGLLPPLPRRLLCRPGEQRAGPSSITIATR